MEGRPDTKICSYGGYRGPIQVAFGFTSVRTIEEPYGLTCLEGRERYHARSYFYLTGSALSVTPARTMCIYIYIFYEQLEAIVELNGGVTA